MARKYKRNPLPVVPMLLLGGVGAVGLYFLLRKDSSESSDGTPAGLLTTPTPANQPELLHAVQSGTAIATKFGFDIVKWITQTEQRDPAAAASLSGSDRHVVLKLYFADGRLDRAEVVATQSNATPEGLNLVQKTANEFVASDKARAMKSYASIEAAIYGKPFTVGIDLRFSGPSAVSTVL